MDARQAKEQGAVSLVATGVDAMAPSSSLLDTDVDALAIEIMGEARMSLMMAYRFMDSALWRMPFKPASLQNALATDGKTLYVDAMITITRFEVDFNEIVRDYLHTILHCIFRHPFDTEHLNVEAWSLACDVVVEAIAIEMAQVRFPSADDAFRKIELQNIEKKLGSLTPSKLYRMFAIADINDAKAVELGFNAAKMWDLRMLFQRDSHSGWLNQANENGQPDPDKKQATRQRNLSDRLREEAQDWEASDVDEIDNDSDSDNDSPNQEDSPDQEQENNQDSRESAEGEDTATEGQSSEEDDASAGSEGNAGHDDDDADDDAWGDVPDFSQLPEPGENEEDDKRAWEDISRQMEMDLQSFSRQSEGLSGDLMANLAIANKKQANYAQFLRQFATLGEDMKVNDDEFDYIFYTYGLKTYGNMPLVEPLEYQETTRVREFVVALDTSGSCSGNLIKQFVTRTYDILRETEGFGDEVNIHLIQCDNKVQADLKITNVEDLEKYCQQFQVFGFGGTDFRPVFDYVDKLIDQGEFEDLRGLIYFTDGLGTFPLKPPAYETAFVFVDDGARSIGVPPWAMKVVLDEDEIRAL